MSTGPLSIHGDRLTLADVERVAAGSRRGLALDDAARARMQRSADWVARVAHGDLTGDDGAPLPVYGVNTGYGSLARVRLEPHQIRELSSNLIRSHAAGTGPMVEPPVVRAMILLRANALAKGASGCRPELVDTLLAMLDADVVPEVPSRGSCGSSGDLAPLAHLGLVVFQGAEIEPGSSGFAWFDGARRTGAEAMGAAGIPRLVPLPKEGLAMCNGAQLTTAYAALATRGAQDLVEDADIVAAMTFEALRGTSRALHPDVHRLRPYVGARTTAARILAFTHGSTLMDSLVEKVQDAYALRCTPQIMGAVRDGVAFVAGQVGVEINAATDNPLILVDHDDVNKAFSAGLFHGEPIGLASDHLRLVLAELASVSERRTYRLATGTLSARLPPLLVGKDRPGLGVMGPHASAAALVAELRSRLWPAGSDSIPTCEDQEDLVAMSTTAARRAWEALAAARRVVAVELFSVLRALRWRLAHEPDVRLGDGTAAALSAVDGLVPDGIHAPSDAMSALESALAAGVLRSAVRRAVPESTWESAWSP
jgi:histidine ammonia-lyase